jgi:hypothetical protein
MKSIIIYTDNRKEVTALLQFEFEKEVDPLLQSFEQPVEFFVETRNGKIKVEAVRERELKKYIKSIMQRNMVHA